MRCYDCQKLALLCTSTSRILSNDPKGRCYLNEFDSLNPNRLFFEYWRAYKACRKYAIDPSLLKNQDEWDLLEEAILRVSPRWQPTHMKLEVENELFEYVKESLLMLSNYWITSMDMVESAFKLFLLEKYDSCYCKYF